MPTNQSNIIKQLHNPTVTSTSSEQKQETLCLLQLPTEIHVNILTYLRAYDLSTVQKTCCFYSNPQLIHKIVIHTAEQVYSAELTKGFDEQPLAYSGSSNGNDNSNKDSKRLAAITNSSSSSKNNKTTYTLEHLRNMELLVVARVLSRPEPASGFFVSKSWCKTALRWLEVQQEEKQQAQHPGKKKLSKKKQRLRSRRLSDASPPWPNVNSDLLCEHQNLQCCSSSKSARARRRLLDKQAWKILKKIYPDSTQLESAVGECLQCALEAETSRKTQQDLAEQAKLERKRPLADPAIRRFYTRTRGVPVQCLKKPVPDADVVGDAKMPAEVSASTCPLQPGLYYVLPRAWCHGWRHYMKTGEGGSFPPPDAAILLCDAHRLPLLPPHLEAYLHGETQQLLLAGPNSSDGGSNIGTAPVPASGHESTHAGSPMASVPRVAATSASVPGQAPDQASLEALRAAGLSSCEVSLQLSAMRSLELHASSRSSGSAAASSGVATLASTAGATVSSPSQHHISRNELLDRENHSVVEILTEEEFTTLVDKAFPGASSGVFSLRFDVDCAGSVTFSTPPCRDCDATGRQCSVSVKNRARGWVRKSSEKARAPASLEY